MKLLRHFTANEEQLDPFPFRRELSMEAYLIENEGVLVLEEDAFSSVEIIEEEFITSHPLMFTSGGAKPF